jgi:beta-xylosidase
LLAGFAGTYPNDTLYLLADAEQFATSFLGMRYSLNVNGRDPSIAKIGSNWVIVCTQDFELGGIDVHVSSDLNLWVKTAIPAVVFGQTSYHVWAPEWAKNPDGTIWLDGGGVPHVYVAINIVNSTGAGFQIYEMHPTASDYSTWSNAALVTITGEINCIDPYPVVIAGNLWLWYVHYLASTNEYIQYADMGAITSSYVGPGTIVQSGQWAGFANGTSVGMEGPCLLQMSDRWRLYLDIVSPNFSSDAGQIHYSDSFDSWATWTTPVTISTPDQVKHSTVIQYP